MRVRASSLDRAIRIERPVADQSFDGAGSGTWELVATVSAQVQDVLPSRSERMDDGLTIGQRRSRVRMRYRADIAAEMRFVMDGRVMHIVSGPAEIGRRDGLEFMVEDYRPAGNPA